MTSSREKTKDSVRLEYILPITLENWNEKGVVVLSKFRILIFQTIEIALPCFILSFFYRLQKSEKTEQKETRRTFKSQKLQKRQGHCKNL